MRGAGSVMQTIDRAGFRWGDEARADCFRAWVEYGRSFRIVSERSGVPELTLKAWARDEDWETRRRDQAAAFLPGMLVESAAALRMAGHSAAVRLQQIAADAVNGIKPTYTEVRSLELILRHSGASLASGVDPASGRVLAAPSLSDAGRAKLYALLGLPAPEPED
jgi:hypothetical protein